MTKDQASATYDSLNSEVYMYKQPENWGLVVALVASLLGFLARYKEAGMFGKAFNFSAFLLDLIISAGLGLLAYWLVIELGQAQSVGAAVAAVVGNVGARVFDMAEKVISKHIAEGEKKE